MSEPFAAADPIDMATLRADLELLRADLAGLRSDTRRYGAARVGEAKGVVETRIRQLQSDIERVTSDLQQQGRDAVALVESRVRERPLTSLAIAFGVGMIAAKILR